MKRVENTSLHLTIRGQWIETTTIVENGTTTTTTKHTNIPGVNLDVSAEDVKEMINHFLKKK